MQKILISNIGNRNLQVNNSFIAKIFDREETVSFKEQTMKILEELKTGFTKYNLKPVIINEVIEKEKQNLKKVILFSSKSPSGERDDQDTLYEGEILCIILSRQYPEIEFENIIIEASVVSHDQLFRTYRSQLLHLKKNHLNDHIIYCDAGGTSQQKFVCKILIEYLFDPSKFTVYYVSQVERGKSKVELGENLEYRRLIDMEHITQAVQNSAYSVALNNLSQLGFKETKMPASLVKLMELRYRLLTDDAICLAKNISQSKKAPQFVFDIKSRRPFGEYSFWKDLLSGEQFYLLCEVLVASQRKFQLGLIEQFLHFFSMFIENYTGFVIKKKLGYSFNKHYETAFNKLIQDVEDGKIVLPENVDVSKRGLPVLLELAELIENSKHKQLLKIIKNLNSNTSGKNEGINTFRNRFAHTGKGVKAEVLEESKMLDDISRIYGLIGLDFNRNYYQEIHDEICEILRST